MYIAQDSIPGVFTESQFGETTAGGQMADKVLIQNKGFAYLHIHVLIQLFIHSLLPSSMELPLFLAPAVGTSDATVPKPRLLRGS